MCVEGGWSREEEVGWINFGLSGDNGRGRCRHDKGVARRDKGVGRRKVGGGRRGRIEDVKGRRGV